ncbi:MAG: DUF4381 domain-containing protein [Alcanivoracaceae bacterium]|nr:DUF4381 domain-containing protein [Alcanivoracaceae bacterium]
MDKTAPALDLRDIHLPADPSMWPLAPGWWLLIIISIFIVYFLIKVIIKIKKRKQLNALMQQQLIMIANEFKKHNNKHLLAIDISQLLKRFVRHVFEDSGSSFEIQYKNAAFPY